MSNNCEVCGTSIPSYRKFCSKSCYGESISNRIERNCGICGNEFTTVPSRNTEYCSRDCAGVARRTSEEVPCENCGEYVLKEQNEINRGNNNFCSNSCHNEYQRKQNAKTCKNCGEKYNGGGKSRKFCSRECFGEYNRVKKVQVDCPECNSVSLVYPSYKEKYKNVFCSSECRSSWLKENSLFSTDNPRYTDGKYNGFGSNWIRQRNKEIKNSNNKCKLCGKNEEENGRDMSVHHIIPRKLFKKSTHFSLEDSNKQGNLISLCRSCHMKAENGSIKKCELYKNNYES